MSAFIHFLQRLIPLSGAEIANLEAALVIKQLDKGHIYLSSGEVCEHICFLNQGKMRAFFTHQNGQEFTWNFHFNDEDATFENYFPFDYLSFVEQTPTFLSFQVEETAEVALLSRPKVQALFSLGGKYQEIGRVMAQQAYASTHRRSFSLLTKTGEELYRELIRTEPYLLQKFPQYQIATYLGIAPESLSRIRRKIRS